MRRTARLNTILPSFVVAPLLAVAPSPAVAQGSTRMPVGVFVGSDQERYLRVLQTLGLVPLYPWSIRGFSLRELDQLRPLSDAHPWAAYRGFAPTGAPRHPFQEAIPVNLNARYNTAFPFGMNDGAVWAGRGLTTSAQAGGVVRQGLVSVVIAPIVFWAENRAFPLMPNGQAGNLRFANPTFPTTVDRPQRFGDGSYARLCV
jgi:hypothetical protein